MLRAIVVIFIINEFITSNEMFVNVILKAWSITYVPVRMLYRCAMSCLIRP